MAISELYLNPPTLGEVYWVSLVGNPDSKDFQISDELERFCGYFYSSFSNFDELFAMRFELPHNLVAADVKLPEIMQAIEKNDDYHGLGRNANVEGLRLAFQSLQPAATLERGNGNCLSLAVLTVAVNRANSMPTRFIVETPTHIVVESRRGENNWHRFDPKGREIGISELHVEKSGWFYKSEYDKAYLKVLKMLNKRL